MKRNRVREGDSLRGIAEAFYGNPNRWAAIWQRNGEKIADPDQIFAGQLLVVPGE